jgi:hypothetical protein
VDNTPNPPEFPRDEPVATPAPKKRSKWKILLFVLWIAVVVAWFALIAKMSG